MVLMVSTFTEVSGARLVSLGVSTGGGSAVSLEAEKINGNARIMEA